MLGKANIIFQVYLIQNSHSISALLKFRTTILNRPWGGFTYTLFYVFYHLYSRLSPFACLACLVGLKPLMSVVFFFFCFVFWGVAHLETKGP